MAVIAEIDRPVGGAERLAVPAAVVVVARPGADAAASSPALEDTAGRVSGGMVREQSMESFRRELESVYDSFHQQLFLCAIVVTRCPDLAEDAMHDAFCRLLRRPTPPEDLKAYVFRSVRNAAIDLMRKRNRAAAVPETWIFAPAPDPWRVVESLEFQRRLTAALFELAEGEREIVMLRLYAELTFREIAELRGDSINTVMSSYRRGLARLRGLLEDMP